MQLAEEDRRNLLALIWCLKPSDLSILHVYLEEAVEAQIATVKDSANDIFYSTLQRLGLASEAALELDSPAQTRRALERAKSFGLSEQGRAELAPLMRIALSSGDPPRDSIVSGEAVQILKHYASQGDAPSQRKLGLLYDNGHGVEQNYSEALEWYKKAAASGDALAHNNIGVMYFAGFGVPRSLAEAMKWFLAAADLGSPGAADNLGEMYARGLGVPQDDAEALKWFRKAADLGHGPARQKLEALLAKGR